MNKQSAPYKRVAFVCTNQREDGRQCCANGGSQEARDTLKARLKEANLASVVRVCQTGCLGKCGDGPNVMVYPENTWFSGVCMEDLDVLYAALIEGVDVSVPPNEAAD